MSVTISGSDHTRAHSRFEGCFASVDLDIEDPRHVNWSNGNARAMFALLCLGDELYGEAALPDVRRAILRARATFDRRAPALVRPEEVGYGAPRENEDGAIELRPVRMWSAGLDVVGIRSRLDAFERCVDTLAGRGATHINWG